MQHVTREMPLSILSKYDKINEILNKGELMNSLARAVFFAKRGEMHERDLQDQLRRASALSIMNAISV